MSVPTADPSPPPSLDVATPVVRELAVTQMSEASALLGRIWRRGSASPVDAAMLVALRHGGNYVAGAFVAGRLVGVCVGFFAQPLGQTLHSHIAGVEPGHAGHGVGRALKAHQRRWARRHGLTEITWTFDPLVARNAYFNLHLLGASPRRYLVNFYGDLSDGVNPGVDSDRLLVSWPAADGDAPMVGAPAGRPVAARAVVALGRDGEPISKAAASERADYVQHADRVGVAIPRDIEAMRRSDPDLAHRWRIVVREALGDLLANGWTIVDVEAAPDHGRYLLGRA